MLKRLAGAWCGLALCASATAAPREARIPLVEGKLRAADLSAALMREAHVPLQLRLRGELDLNGLRGNLLLAGLNASLGDGCSVTLGDDALVFHFDPDKLPRGADGARRALRTFTETAAPDATAAQQREYGLFMPAHVDPARKMVLLVHGLDCGRENWKAMGELLAEAGYQVAYFAYPDDQGLEESGRLLRENLVALRETFPGMRVDVIGHSMGGLVARAAIEEDGYPGGVGRLILIATPNGGSNWAPYRLVLEAQEHYDLWRHDQAWCPTWAITDGLGEAGRDLRPGSKFLRGLNRLPRREGVSYTVIAGSQDPISRVAGHCLAVASRAIGGRAAGVWGLRQIRGGLADAADSLSHRTGRSDGPVTVKSTCLEGVEDVVVLPADHATLYLPIAGNPPAAWETVKDRLARPE